jgi:hypothetical protein
VDFWTFVGYLACIPPLTIDAAEREGLSKEHYMDDIVRLKEGKNLIDVPMTPFWLDCTLRAGEGI